MNGKKVIEYLDALVDDMCHYYDHIRDYYSRTGRMPKSLSDKLDADLLVIMQARNIIESLDISFEESLDIDSVD